MGRIQIRQIYSDPYGLRILVGINDCAHCSLLQQRDQKIFKMFCLGIKQNYERECPCFTPDHLQTFSELVRQFHCGIWDASMVLDGMSQNIKVNSTISTVLRNTSEYGSLCNFLGVILKNLQHPFFLSIQLSNQCYGPFLALALTV